MWLEASTTTGTTHSKKKKKKKKKKELSFGFKDSWSLWAQIVGGGEQYHPLSNSERVSSPSPHPSPPPHHIPPPLPTPISRPLNASLQKKCEFGIAELLYFPPLKKGKEHRYTINKMWQS